MAAPVATTRGTPAGIMLKDGYKSLITFARLTTASFWEKTVQPVGIDGGEPIEQTTMHNSAWRTTAPRSLMTLTPFTVKAAYDPNFLNTSQVQSLINQPDTITQRFADGTTIAFYGYLQKFEPAEMSEGAQPEATLTIVPTNFDHVNKVEAGPVITSVSGT